MEKSTAIEQDCLNCDDNDDGNDGNDDNEGGDSLEEMIIVAASSPGSLQGRSESPVVKALEAQLRLEIWDQATELAVSVRGRAGLRSLIGRGEVHAQ